MNTSCGNEGIYRVRHHIDNMIPPLTYPKGDYTSRGVLGNHRSKALVEEVALRYPAMERSYCRLWHGMVFVYLKMPMNETDRVLDDFKRERQPCDCVYFSLLYVLW